MVCPACKGSGRLADTLDNLVRRMKATKNSGGLDIYTAANGGYFLTYGGGQVDYALIQEGLHRGVLEPTYPDAPEGCWSLTELRGERIARFNPTYQAKLKEKGLI